MSNKFVREPKAFALGAEVEEEWLRVGGIIQSAMVTLAANLVGVRSWQQQPALERAMTAAACCAATLRKRYGMVRK